MGVEFENGRIYQLQYRKRYELLQLSWVLINLSTWRGYNTASGMSCCNLYKNKKEKHAWRLQYRKRYELLQQDEKFLNKYKGKLLQYRKRYELLQRVSKYVSP